MHQVDERYPTNKSGLTHWMWSEVRIEHARRNGIEIPEHAYLGPYHPVESEAPPANVGMSGFLNADITAEEAFKVCRFKFR